MSRQSANEPYAPRTPSGAGRNTSNAEKVARVAEWLKNRRSTAPLSRRKRVVSHQVPKRHDKKYSDDKIDLTDLDQVVEIDPERSICIAEPGVPFNDLVDQTLHLGLVPIVVPELETITIGGAVAGC